MALTFTTRAADVPADHSTPPPLTYHTVTDVTFDFQAPYTTGGVTITAAQLGLSRAVFAVCNIVTAGTLGTAVNASYDVTTSKLKLNTASAEVGNGIDITPLVARIVAYGYR